MLTNYDGLYKKNYYGEKLFENHFSDKKLGFQVIEGGIILPQEWDLHGGGSGGIIDAEGNFIERSSVHAGFGYSYPAPEVEESDETVIYFGMLIHVWGHCLTDDIKRVWFLKSEIFRQDFKNCPVVYVPSFYGIVPNLARLLEILEIKVENLREIKNPTKFKKIILPDESFFLDKGALQNYHCTIEGSKNNFQGFEYSFFTQEYFDTVEQVRHFAKKNFTPLAQKKFFLYSGKMQCGEEYLSEYFSAKGYEEINPAELTLDEQLNIFANCESFASVVGSISHNIIFLQDKTQTILIPRRASSWNVYQAALDQLQDLEIFYIDSSMSIYAKSQDGPFCYIISEQLQKFFDGEVSDKYNEQNFYTFLIYSKLSREKGYRVNLRDEKYFGDLIADFMKNLKQNSNFLKK